MASPGRKVDAARPEGSGPLDPTYLDSLRKLGELTGKPLVQEIVESYLTEIPRRLERLRDALGRADAKDFTLVAHSLKGSSAQIGAARVAAASVALEERGHKGELGGVADLLADLEREIGIARPLLEQQT